MCAPKAPPMSAAAGTVAPARLAAVLPDGGDPGVRGGMKGLGKLARSAMILTNQSGGLGAPTVASLGAG